VSRQKRKNKILNYLQVFDSIDDYLYRENVHLSNEGRKRVAQRMAAIIMHELYKQGE
jgi:hypothetical protein